MIGMASLHQAIAPRVRTASGSDRIGALPPFALYENAQLADECFDPVATARGSDTAIIELPRPLRCECAVAGLEINECLCLVESERLRSQRPRRWLPRWPRPIRRQRSIQ